MILKVLGPGCINCKTLFKRVEFVLKELGLKGEIYKVEDFKEIAAYGVMKTPALIIDEKLISYGRVPGINELKEILLKFGN